MKPKQVLSKLKQARRALDSLSQVEIIDEWDFDEKIKCLVFAFGYNN